jgi:hypothetical protein
MPVRGNRAVKARRHSARCGCRWLRRTGGMRRTKRTSPVTIRIAGITSVGRSDDGSNGLAATSNMGRVHRAQQLRQYRHHAEHGVGFSPANLSLSKRPTIDGVEARQPSAPQTSLVVAAYETPIYPAHGVRASVVRNCVFLRCGHAIVGVISAICVGCVRALLSSLCGHNRSHC